MKILISSIGRRNYLAQWFRDAGTLVDCDLTLIGTDSDAYASGLTEVDVPLVVPSITSPLYVDTLADICDSYGIDLLLSVHDYDIAKISDSKMVLESHGMKVAVPPAETLLVTADKYQTFLTLSENDFMVPHTFLAEDAMGMSLTGHNQVVVKHRFGSGSSGVFVVDQQRLLSAILLSSYSAPSGDGSASQESDLSRVLVQQHVIGDEYGLDVICDFAGNFQGVLARKKLRMRSGETDRAVTVDPSPFLLLGERLSRVLTLSGNTDVDVIVTEDRQISVIDINTRFGGGYPFVHIAGANIPACYLSWAADSPIDTNWLRYEFGIVGSKYQEIMRSVQP